MIDIDHRKGTIYLSGGMEYAPADDPLGGKWRQHASKELDLRGFVPFDITELDLQYRARHGNIMKDIRFETFESELHRKAAIRTHFVDTDLKLIEDDTDAVVLYYNESARRGAGTISEAQFAYLYDIPIFIVSKWENWHEELPSWLHAISTKVFTNFDDLFQYMNDLPEGILRRDQYGNHGTESHYLCSLSGEVFEKQNHHFVSKVSPLYSKEAVTVVRKTREDAKNRYEFIDEYLVKTLGDKLATYQRLADVICSDADYAHGWLANISVCIQDAGGDRAVAQDAAERFLAIAFGSKLTFKEYEMLCKMAKDKLNTA